MMMANDDDVGNILTSLGIEKDRIVPTNVSQRVLRQHSKFNQFESKIPHFPLEWFDCDNENDGKQFFVGAHSTEGIAFLPTTTASSSTSTQISPNDFEWRQVNIVQYNETTHKWRVVLAETENGTIYEVPRIYLMFIAENRMKFVERIKRSVQLRDDSECHLRFEAVLDGFGIDLQPTEHIHNRIRKLLERQCKKQSEWIEFYQREYTIVFQKFLAVMYLEKFIEEQRKSRSSSHGTQIQLPTRQERKLKNLLSQMQKQQHRHRGENEMIAENRKKSRREIQQLWLYCCPQSIKIMEFIVDECEHVSQGGRIQDGVDGMSLFHLQTTPCTLENFFRLNQEKMLSMSNFLQAQWIEKIVYEIQKQLATMPMQERKGWFDLNVKSWETFKMSKLHRLLEMIKVRMEVAVMMLLKLSLSAFVNHLCQPCKCFLHVSTDFEWNKNDLTNSPFQPSTNSIFHMYLHIDDDKPTFSTKLLDTLEHDIVHMFLERILTTHQIPQIDSHLITRLKFDEKNLKLSSSIGVLNEDIQHQIFQMRQSIQKSLIPLQAYARQYEKFVPLMQLNVDNFVDDHENFKVSKNISDEIKSQIEIQEELKIEIPENIEIGPFFVDVAQLKSQLIAKREEIISALKQKLLKNVTEKLSSIQSRYENIFTRISERSSTIEHLQEIVNYIPSIQSEIQKLGVEMKAALSDFFVIDSFLIIQPDELFSLKWKALQMPQIITNCVNETLAQREQEIERFRKLQASDETVFLERLEAIEDEVSASLRKYAFDDVTVAQSSFEKTWKLLNETRKRGDLLNQRWRILNQYKTSFDEDDEDDDGNEKKRDVGDNEIDMAQLNVEMERLHPYHNFWTMTSNFLLSKEVWWTQMPLSELNIESIGEEMKRYDEEIMMASHEFFASENDLDLLRIEFREMKKCIDIVRDLKNLDFKNWLKLNARINASLNYSTSTISDLMMRGIPSVIADIVKELVLEADLDATREREEKIRAEIEEEERRGREEELLKQKQMRRAKRPDLFN